LYISSIHLVIIVLNTNSFSISDYFFIIIANLRLTTKKRHNRKMTDRIAGYGNVGPTFAPFHLLCSVIFYIFRRVR